MIDNFTRQYEFLSNFYPCHIEFEGKSYNSVEHAYQAAKTTDPQKKEEIRAVGPRHAKKLGKTVPLRSDWESIKMDIMHYLLQQKFKTGSPLADLLLQTGTQDLIEGNAWGDRFWGQTKSGGKWVGKNHLGRLLMLVRQELSISLPKDNFK